MSSGRTAGTRRSGPCAPSCRRASCFTPRVLGLGVAVIDAGHASPEAAAALALEVAAFDQRGCLSRRAAVVLGDARAALAFAELVARALGALSERMPLGLLDDEELAEITRFRTAGATRGRCSRPVPAGWSCRKSGARARRLLVGICTSCAAASLVGALAELDPARITDRRRRRCRLARSRNGEYGVIQTLRGCIGGIAPYDDPDRGSDRNIEGARCRCALGLVQYLFDPGSCRRRDCPRTRHAGVRHQG